ncbi:sulfotransferase [Sphingobium sufflavum]|uniref:sulfotransferase family protein n=1 Tax=Sphingobium sufflavum TaxID=1129547 RepID=UPI001F248029|nr:sulfotransferase [Sphingobium sufflavum]MCE7797951.1 sulfotransferase [Sphingobium sufflavum]
MQGLEDRIAPPTRFARAADLAHELAAAKYGADDFGPDDYQEGLRILLLSMDYDPSFTERGRAIAWGSVVNTLAARAHAVRAMKERPGFDAVPMLAPVIITGIPRTGTTALHKLMAVDPQFQGLQGWLMDSPMVRPPRDTWDANPLFQDAVARLAERYAATPDKFAAHAMASEEVDECLGLLRQGFVSNLWNCGWSAPSYDLWWQNQSELASYRWLRSLYQLIGADAPDKRWLLKNPGHVDNLDIVFAIFPDAKVVLTHRDPAKAVPSLCSLLMRGHALMEDSPAALRAPIMGMRETEKWARAIRRSEAVRATHGAQILDVVQGDLHRDPMTVIDRIYGFAGLDLSEPVRAAMAERIAADPESAHGAHRYSVGDFGLTEGAIRERFGDYVERFGLREGKTA